MMIPKQRKSSPPKGGNRLLISINVLGSAGPLRFLVNEEELVITVIETALRNYAREGRLPILGSDLNGFLLYCANAGTDPFSPLETIGSRGGRNFMLCKKPPQMVLTEVSPERKTEKVGFDVNVVVNYIVYLLESYTFNCPSAFCC